MCVCLFHLHSFCACFVFLPNFIDFVSFVSVHILVRGKQFCPIFKFNLSFPKYGSDTRCFGMVYFPYAMHYLQINTWAFPYWPGYHPEPPNMGRGMITRPIWKCLCIKLFITYFRHLEKRHPYWPETKSRPILAWANMGLDMEMIL